jgi:guanylate kinase
LKFSVSVTTRKPRDGEQEGVDYYYISDERYNQLRAEDAFYEYVDSQYGSRYGTLKSEVDRFINVGQDVLFDMDWMGARQMRRKAPDDVVAVYILPPSVQEVRRRLENRHTDSKEVIDKRMSLIKEKIEHWNEFDYVIINDDLEETIYKIQKIISCERMKRCRQTGLAAFVRELLKEADAQ